MSTKYPKLVITLIATWFVASFIASAIGLFKNDASVPRLPFLFFAVAPLVGFIVWFTASRQFREFLLSLDPRWLTAAQTWRVNGFVFLLLMSYGLLPAIFAEPAGWGDIFIGATAPLVAWKLTTPRHRASFMLWQALGMADLISAVSFGTMARFIDPNSVSMQPMTLLPLSLVPTFLVPLFFMVHIVCIAQALRWQRSAAVGQHVSGIA